MEWFIDAEDRQRMEKTVPANRLQRANILITGGSGFVGRWMRAAVPDQNVTCLGSGGYLLGLWKEVDWQYIIHLAPAPVDDVIAVARRCGARVLYASSGAVHDSDPGEYALAKTTAEMTLLTSDIDAVIARLYAFSGAGCGHAPGEMICSAKVNNVIYYRENIFRSYLYAADMAVWLWRLLLDGMRDGVYDIGSPTPVSLCQLAYAVQEALPPWKDVQVLPYPGIIAEADPRPYYVPERARDTMLELEVRQTVDFEEGILKTVMAYFQSELKDAGY